MDDLVVLDGGLAANVFGAGDVGTIRPLSQAIGKGMSEQEARTLWEKVTAEGPPTEATVAEAIGCSQCGVDKANAKANADPIVKARKLTTDIENIRELPIDVPIVDELLHARDVLDEEINRRKGNRLVEGPRWSGTGRSGICGRPHGQRPVWHRWYPFRAPRRSR